MDWVHCNNCYTQPREVEMKKFFITNCGHIYCDECLQLNKSNECKICHVKYTTIPLTSNMNSEVEIYFQDPAINLKKQVKILEFQQSHRVRLVSHNRERIRNYKAIKKENYSLNEELKLCKKENASLRKEIQRIKLDLNGLKRKFDLSSSCNLVSSQRTPELTSFNQFITNDVRSPLTTPKNIYKSSGTPGEVNFNSTLKRPSNSNFFLMTESQPDCKERKHFTTQNLSRFPGTYRNRKMSTPDLSTPPTPETIVREYSQRDLLQRKVKLPGSKNDPSPATRLGFHGLTLSRPTSTPKKDITVTNKYHKYFK